MKKKHNWNEVDIKLINPPELCSDVHSRALNMTTRTKYEMQLVN